MTHWDNLNGAEGTTHLDNCFLTLMRDLYPDVFGTFSGTDPASVTVAVCEVQHNLMTIEEMQTTRI